MRSTSSSGPAGVGAPATTGSAEASLDPPALVQQRRGVRVVVDHELDQVQPPQRARQRPRGRARPQLGDVVDAVLVGERDEPVDDLAVRVRPARGEERVRGRVGDARHLGGILGREPPVEELGGPPHGLVELPRIVAHPSRLPAPQSDRRARLTAGRRIDDDRIGSWADPSGEPPACSTVTAIDVAGLDPAVRAARSRCRRRRECSGRDRRAVAHEPQLEALVVGDRRAVRPRRARPCRPTPTSAAVASPPSASVDRLGLRVGRRLDLVEGDDGCRAC